MTGTIKRLVTDHGFGFITAADGAEYFFHVTAMVDQLGRERSRAFAELNVGDRVSFEPEAASERGPRAALVQRLSAGSPGESNAS